MKRNYLLASVVSLLACLSFTTVSVAGSSIDSGKSVVTFPNRQDTKQVVELTKSSLYKKPTSKKATIKVNNYLGKKFRVIKCQIVKRDGKNTRFAYIKNGKTSGWIQVKYLALYC
ncbi:GW dipeptide domain-containing protein [Lentilactobacillus sp. Marseille-Q4993]|uniref:GW dipeptide domain-containing protein n=1 Tax=Lentilactobacillus sp. Marseille-Q4993 TaxID=3039492 RepID=UPI0024BC02B2|nr:GW dipeptide domain-containing protein [Lentilactobacillus sp. Marseille-Q4993]